jgi:hypothetical protein
MLQLLASSLEVFFSHVTSFVVARFYRLVWIDVLPNQTSAPQQQQPTIAEVMASLSLSRLVRSQSTGVRLGSVSASIVLGGTPNPAINSFAGGSLELTDSSQRSERDGRTLTVDNAICRLVTLNSLSSCLNHAVNDAPMSPTIDEPLARPIPDVVDQRATRNRRSRTAKGGRPSFARSVPLSAQFPHVTTAAIP